MCRGIAESGEREWKRIDVNATRSRADEGGVEQWRLGAGVAQAIGRLGSSMAIVFPSITEKNIPNPARILVFPGPPRTFRATLLTCSVNMPIQALERTDCVVVPACLVHRHRPDIQGSSGQS